MWAKNKQSGFTIVELLIVIVVIGILVAITVVAYNGIQQRAKNAAITSSLDNSIKLLNLYRVENGHWPIEDQASSYIYCLGRNFPGIPYQTIRVKDSPTAIQPAQGCNDSSGSVRKESAWLSDVISSYGNLPGPVATSSTSAYKYTGTPTYVTVPDSKRPDLRDLNLTYPPKAPTDIGIGGSPGSRHYIRYALAGNVPGCGDVQHAQFLSLYSTWTRCVVLLESYE